MKKCFIDKKKALEICEKYPTPFYLYDESGIRETARKLYSAFSWNRGFKEYYAVKACPNPFILKILREEGCGADCSSYNELMICDSLGMSGNEIMFSSNVTPGEDYEYARSLNASINLDDITHIDFLAEHGGIPEEICMRYNPGGDFNISGAIMGNPGEAKYGMTASQIVESVKKLRKMGAKTFGIHAFLASNMLANDYYPTLAGVILRLAADVYRKTGTVISFINLSGGIGIPYRPEDSMPDISYIGEAVRKEFAKAGKEYGIPEPQIRTELGRFMTGPYGILVTKAIHKKEIYKNYIGVDACAANLMRPAMYGAYHHITVLGKENAPCDRKYDVTGGLCENNDKFAVDRYLPEIENGDLLVIHDCGAHGFAMGYNYNGKMRSAELLLHPDGSFSMIRRAETPEDYFATFDFCDCMEKGLDRYRKEKGQEKE